MSTRQGFKVVALAASIALAMGSTVVMAADPAGGQVPGQGKVTAVGAAPTVTFTTGGKTMGIALGSSTVIDWGKGTTASDINNTGTAGFNIGADASVTFSGAYGVLNVDSTGNPSQIFGHLSSANNVYVANANGIVVGQTAVISGGAEVGLIANIFGTGAFDGTAVPASIEYNSTGGDVSVAKGATLDGATVLVSGGGTVNVDLGGIHALSLRLIAGLPSDAGYDVPNNSFTTPGFGTLNANAALNLTGTLPVGTTFSSTGGLASGGDITISGDVDANDALIVAAAGTLTNNGSLAWGHAGSMTPGNVVNNGSMSLNGSVAIGGKLTNGGSLTGPMNAILTNGVNNVGSITAAVIQSHGDFTNSGTVSTSASGASLVSSSGIVPFAGTYAAGVTVIDGNFTNSGELNSVGGVSVTNGSLSNSGQLTVGNSDVGGAGPNLITTSDKTLTGFSKTGAYFIDNTGTITSGTTDFALSVNDQATPNGSTGSFTNTGTLNLSAGGALTVSANNNVSLGGTLKAGATPAALSATNPLGDVSLTADSGLNGTGAASVLTPVFFGSGAAQFSGAQVKVMDNITGGTAAAPLGILDITAGAALDGDYSVRVASGKTVSASTVNVQNATDATANVILQGTVAGHIIKFGTGGSPIGDVVTGPAGGLTTTGANPTVTFNFNGRIKNAPYLNDANFRYNYLPITNAGTGAVDLRLNPVDYKTNGTSNGLSGVNILVNGDVALTGITTIPAQASAATAVTGVTNWENTHLVLQSTGNIATNGAAFYWPGYVYLGNIDSTDAGAALPGTLSAAGKITLGGPFNNVLPGDVAGASGIHFMTGNALTGGTVATNANAFVNFAMDLLSQNYAQGILTSPTFTGGVAADLVVNYGALDASMFNTHPVDATK